MKLENQNQEEGMGKEKTQVVLQPRDKEALKLIYEQQFLTFDQYKKFFFKNAWPQQARARLLKLQRAGFVRKALSPTLGQAQVIKLTPMGAQMMNQFAEHPIPYNQRIEHGSAIHDKIVTDIRVRLQEWVPDSTWLPERLLKAQEWATVPDGALTYYVGDKAVTMAVEFERFQKEEYRYSRNFSFFNDQREYTWKLYVAPTKTLFNTLIRVFFGPLKHLSERIALVYLDDLMNGYPPFEFTEEARQVFQPPKEKITL